MSDCAKNFAILPAVHEVLEQPCRRPRATIRGAGRRRSPARHRRARARDPGRAAPDGIDRSRPRVERALAALDAPSLRRVINATGVVLHTNLGRAPLGPLALLPGYSNLEYDLAAGRRGKRDVHAGGAARAAAGRARHRGQQQRRRRLSGAERTGRRAAKSIVSRGELIEIGDGFRIPDIMARSGAVLREVGTTNRTAHRRLPRTPSPSARACCCACIPATSA